MHWSNMSNELVIKVNFLKAWHFVFLLLIPFITWKLILPVAIHWLIMWRAEKLGTTDVMLIRRLRKGLSRRSRTTHVNKRNERISLISEANKLL